MDSSPRTLVVTKNGFGKAPMMTAAFAVALRLMITLASVTTGTLGLAGKLDEFIRLAFFVLHTVEKLPHIETMKLEQSCELSLAEQGFLPSFAYEKRQTRRNVIPGRAPIFAEVGRRA